jgi:RNA polymerase sigma-70 factor, ECF subfamily
MDTDLVIRAQRGDEAAFAAITSGVYVRLRAAAYRILRDPHLAEDATQVALLGIWRKLPTLRDPARFEAWSYRFLVRACADEARRTRRALPDTPVMPEPIAPDEYGGVFRRDELERAFAVLNVEQRAVIVLRHFLDLKLEDVAQALGVPLGTVNSRLNRAMAKLRDALGAEEPGAAVAPWEVAS